MARSGPTTVLRIQYPCYGHFFAPLNSRRLDKQRELPTKKVRIHFDFLVTSFTSGAALGGMGRGRDITHLAPSLPPSALCGEAFFPNSGKNLSSSWKNLPRPQLLDQFSHRCRNWASTELFTIYLTTPNEFDFYQQTPNSLLILLPQR